MRKLSHKEQVAAIAKVNPDVEVLGEIINSRTKVLCRCKVCDHEWSPTPHSLKGGQACPKCYNLRRGQNQKLSHEEQVAAIAKINPDIEVTGVIINDMTKVSCRCKVCSHEWSARPHDLKKRHGCPKCMRARQAQKKIMSHKEHVAAIYKLNPRVEVLGIITGYHDKVLCRCKVCKYEWYATPRKLKSGSGCHKCGQIRSAQKHRLSHEEHVAAIAKANPYVEVLEEIINCTTKVLCRCKICDHEWSAKPHNLKHGTGCPKCAKYGFLRHEDGKLYIMVDDLEVPTIMKIGVSVKETKRRNEILKSAHKAGVRISDLHVVKTWEGPTEKVQELESAMHKAFSNYRINFPVKFDGSNEFFHYRSEVFSMVESTCSDIVNKNAA